MYYCNKDEINNEKYIELFQNINDITQRRHKSEATYLELFKMISDTLKDVDNYCKNNNERLDNMNKSLLQAKQDLEYIYGAFICLAVLMLLYITLSNIFC